ncbi:MAG: S41 family peptidase [bacterium]|nr:S41 family peptidase [bacterium]
MHGSDDFSYDLIVFDYLSQEPSWALDGAITYDWIAEGVGYIHIRDFRAAERDATAAMDGILAEFADASSIIVDVRNTPGGTGQVANRLADRFADRRRHFMSSRMRYGPEHDSTLPMHFHVQPRGPKQFTKSTILLTNRSTASAAERFTLAMRVLPHVTHVGDYTSGAFSAQYPAQLPNEWTLLISYKMSMDHTGLCWDGIGVMPDLFVRNTAEEIRARSDRALEFAVKLLEHAPLELQDESASLLHVRTSLVEAYVDGLEAGGVEAAVGAVREARSGDEDSYFLDGKHCLKTAQEYVQRKRASEVIPLLELCRDTYPQVAMTYGLLAEAYLNSGDVESASAVIAAGESVTPTFPWERPLLDRVRASLEEQATSP